MSHFAGFLVTLLTSHAFAADPQIAREQIYKNLSACDQAIYSDDAYLVVGAPGTAGEPNQVQVFALATNAPAQIISVYDTIIDVKVQANKLYVLTESTFAAWDLLAQKSLFIYASHPNAHLPSGTRAHAKGFITDGKTAVIAHGTRGIAVLDLTSGQFVKLIKMPSVSAAEDIDWVDAKTAIIAVDDDAQDQFHGLYVFDLDTYEITKMIDVENFAMQSVRVSGNQLFLVYFNAIWELDLAATLATDKISQPKINAWKFPGVTTVDLVGHLLLDKKNVYTCMNVADQNGREKATPMTFSLQSLGL